jgi:hypothetical protein
MMLTGTNFFGLTLKNFNNIDVTSNREVSSRKIKCLTQSYWMPIFRPLLGTELKL